MKKISISIAKNGSAYRLSDKRSLMKALFWIVAVVSLSHVSPSFAENATSKEMLLASVERVGVADPKSDIAADGGDENAIGVLSFSKKNYLTVLNAALTSGVNASSDYVNFLINALLDRSNAGSIVNVLIADGRHPSQRMLNIGDKNKRSFLNPQLTVGDNFPLQQFNKNGKGAVLMNVSDDFRNDSFAGLRSTRMEGSGITPRVSTAEDSKWNTLLTNDDRYFLGYYSIGIGRYVSAGAERPFGTSGKVAAEKSIAIGFKAEVRENLSIALGADTIAVEKYGIVMGASSITLSEGAMAIGYMARAGKRNDQGIFNVRNLAKYATALGFQAEAMAESSVALGAYSFVDTAADVAGYVPFGRNIQDDKGYVWKSTLGAISVGNLDKEQTRQIIGVAAGTQDTDAVNVAQLKAVESSAGSWQTSVNGKDNMVVSTGKTVDFSTGSDNLAIIKESTDSGISLKFDLAKEIKLNKITVGANVLDATGLIITDGPSITTTGINAGNKKITGLDKGTEDSDAVNFLQLNELKKQVEGSQLVKQDANTKNITIGKETEGTTINIANKDGANRIISSVEDGKGSHDAVNKGQLDNSIRSVNNNITNKFDELTQNITNVTQKIEGNFLLWSEADHAFVAQHNEGEHKTNSKLTFLLKGDIHANSTDAITGSQLYDLGSKMAKYFGGSTSYEKGEWISTPFEFKTVDAQGTANKQSYNSVATAFSGVGTSFENIINSFDKKIEETTQKVENNIAHITQKVQGDALLWDKEQNAFIAQHGKEEKENNKINSRITFLANGRVGEDSTDAVTGSQLYALGKSVAQSFGGASYENGTWTAPQFEFKTVGTDGKTKDNSYGSVTTAFTGIGTSFENIVNNFDKKIEEKTQDVLNNVTQITQQVQGDALLWDTSKKAFVAQHGEGQDKKNSKITSLLNGDINSDSTDAITGSQLHTLGTNIAKSLGGSASYNDGTWTDPIFTIKQFSENGSSEDKTYNNVASAFVGIGKSFTNIQNKIITVKNEIANEFNQIKDNALLWDEKVGAFVAKHAQKRTDDSKGDDGNINSRITFLQAGKISSNSTDAITGSQLHALGTDVAKYLGGGAEYKDGIWTDPTFTIKQFNEDGTFKDKTYNNVAAVFADVDKNFTNVVRKLDDKVEHVTQQFQGDALLWSDSAQAFVARHEKKNGQEITTRATQENSKITFLANGDVSTDSTDAITGSQLYDLGDSVAKYFGGSARYENGKWVFPEFKFQAVGVDGKTKDGSYDSVISAFSGVGTSFENIVKSFDKKIKEETQKVENNVTNITQQVQGDALLWDDKIGAFVAQHVNSGEDDTKVASKITFLVNGSITEGSTDAITGGQLYETNSKLVQYLGGGASYDGAGNWKTPSFKFTTVQSDGTEDDTSYSSVASAFTGVGESFKNVVKQFGEKVEHAAQAIQDDALMWDSSKDAFVVQHGEDKTNSKITSLFNGNISATSTDAITGSQLYDLGSKVAKYFGGSASYENGTWVATPFKFQKVDSDGEIEEGSYDSVASAFTGVGDSFKNVVTKINNKVDHITEQVQGNALLWDKGQNAFVAQHRESGEDQKKNNSKITSLANGDINATSTDAVTGSQLYFMNKQFADYLGGGAGYGDEGNWQGPHFTFTTVKDDGTEGKGNYNSVSDAFVGVGESFENVVKKIDDKVEHVTQTVQGDALLWDEGTNSFVAKHVKSGEGDTKVASKITFLAKGSITEDSTDAITGSQLYTLGTSIAEYFGGNAEYKDGKWTSSGLKFQAVGEDGTTKDNSYDNVTTAFAGVGTSFENIVKIFDKRLKETTEKIENNITEVTQQVQGDALLWDKGQNAFVAQHGEAGEDDAKINSKITFLANGDINTNSSDAVNGSQLYTLGMNVAKSLGGDAKYEDGKWTAPSYTVSSVDDKSQVKKNEFHDVGSTVTELDKSINNINDHLSNAVKGFDKKIDEVSQGIQDNALLWDNSEKAFVAQHLQESEGDVERGGVKSNSKIKYLANGDVGANSSDAVNGSQLYTLGKNIATSLGGDAKYEDGTWTPSIFTLKQFDEDGTSKDATYHNVAAVFAGVDANFTNVVKNFDDKLEKTTREIENNITHITEHVQGDALLWSKDKEAFVAAHGKDGAESKITSLANGEVSANSTDAITGSQLHALGADIAQYFGGGAKYENGTWTAPNFEFQKIDSDGKTTVGSYDSVAYAFSGVGDSFKNVVKTFDDKIAKTTEEIQSNIINITKYVQDEALLWNDNKGGFVATHGDDDAKSKITSLADGDINANSTDAITGSQLYALGTDVAQYLGGARYENGKWVAPHFKFQTVGEDGTTEESSYKSVASAFTGVGKSFKNVVAKINNKVEHITEQVQSDALLWSNNTGAFVATHGKDGAKSKITSLANGDINTNSTDAITGSQIHALGTNIATSLGGNAKYGNGAWTDPTFMINQFSKNGSSQDESYHDVASAFAGLDTSVHNVVHMFDKKVADVTKHLQDDALLWSSHVGAFVAMHGEADAKRNSKITSLANGDINANSTDAITGSQLYKLAHQVAGTLGKNASISEDGDLTVNGYVFDDVDTDGQVIEKDHQTIMSAFSGVGDSLKNVVQSFDDKLAKTAKEIENNITHITEQVQGDALLWDKDAGAFVAKHGDNDAKSNSKITSLANGDINGNSTDAINGSQLHALGTNVAQSLGGDAQYENGKWVAPHFKFQTVGNDGTTEEGSYDNVASAFVGVGESFTNLRNEFKSEINKVVGDSLVKQDKKTGVISIGGEKSGSEITLANSDGVARTLSGVKDGAISSTSTEAINGSQLYSLNQTLAQYFGGGAGYENGQWTSPTFMIKQFSKNGSSQEENYHDVASAFDGVNDSMNNINDRLNDVAQTASSGLNWQDDKSGGGFDASHNGHDSKIKHLKGGEIKQGSTEAVNGGQLWDTNNRVTKVENKVHSIDEHVKDIEFAVTDGAVNYDKGTDGKKSNSITLKGGNESEPVLINNVADGEINKDSHYAVNGGQLYDYTKKQMDLVLDDAKKYTDERVKDIVSSGVNEAKFYTDMKFEALSYAIEDVRKEARQAAAIGLAVANLRYNDTPGKLSVAIGSGIWERQSAFAVGAGYTSQNGDMRSSLSITSAGSRWGVGAGFSMTLN